jgi:hypothetical protein
LRRLDRAVHATDLLGAAQRLAGFDRQFPQEFAPCDRRPLPIDEPEPSKLWFQINYPAGSFEKVMAQGAKIIKQLNALPPEIKVGGPPKAERNGNEQTAEKVSRLNVFTGKLSWVEPESVQGPSGHLVFFCLSAKEFTERIPPGVPRFI